jgi:hypothetical protein
MRNRKVAVSGCLAASLVVAAACSEAPPTEPHDQGADVPSLFAGAEPMHSAEPFGLDGHFLRIAEEMPGFGGLFYGEDGALNVYTTADATPTATRALAARVAAIGVDLDAQPVRVLRGEYDFPQLYSMLQRVNTLLVMNGVIYTDADERRNRVVVGVLDATAEADVRNALAMLDVPAAAVIIERTEPMELDQGLRDRIRPVPGGVQIAFDRAGSTFICTHGFNVRAPTRPAVQGFVTNSHCSRVRSSMQSTPYWQPSRVADNLLGEEVHDIPPFTGGACPAGAQCRYSDALGVQYDLGGQVMPGDIDFGKIARTLFSGTTNPGSLDIDPANPRWEIVAENVNIVGHELHKTGRTSGWTRGPVNATCQNVSVSGFLLLCQDRITNLRQGGDSGSPYFRRLGEGNDVALAGVHWGGSGDNAALSNIQGIRADNPGPVGWITYPGQTPPN